MKSKFFVIGCLIAGICFLSSCKDDDPVIKGISVSPSTIPAMEVGDEVDLTATVSPADASDEVEWVSENTEIVRVTKTGATTGKITALSHGTTNVFATNKKGTVMSAKIAVTVNIPQADTDYAELLASAGGIGSFLGLAEGYGGIVSDLECGISFTRTEKNKVKISMISGMAGVECEGEQIINLMEGDSPNIGVLLGTAQFRGMGQNLVMEVTGTYNTTTKALRIEMIYDEWDPPLDLYIDAVPGVYEVVDNPDYTLTCWAKLSLTGDLLYEEIKVGLYKVSDDMYGVKFAVEKVDLGLGAPMDIPFEGSVTFAEGEWGGELFVSLMGSHRLVVREGTSLDIATRTMTLIASGRVNLGAVFDATVEIVISNVAEVNHAEEVLGTYYGEGTMTGGMSGPVTDVVITLEDIDSNSAVNAIIEAVLPGMGKQVFETVLSVSENYELEGSASITSPMPITFAITGTVNIDDNTIELTLDAGAMATIVLTAERDPAPNYAADIVGEYHGDGVMTGMLEGDVTDVVISLVYSNKTTVIATIDVVMPAPVGVQNLQSDLTVSEDYELTGSASITSPMELTFAITGTADPTDKTIELTLTATGVATVVLTAAMEDE